MSLRIDGRPVKASSGSSLLHAAVEAGVIISAPCGGRGTCGKCRVVVDRGATRLSGVQKLEKRAITDDEFSEGYRLACVAILQGPGEAEIHIPPESRFEAQKLLVAGLQSKVVPEPMVRKFFIAVRKPSRGDVASDEARILDQLRDEAGSGLRMGYDALRIVPETLRDGDWKVTAVVRGPEVIWLEKGDTTLRSFGFAVDIGTTKLAGYLIELNSGRIVAVSSQVNPQSPFGSDVISRTSFIGSDRSNLERLQRAVVQGIQNLILDVCSKANVAPTEIYEIAAVGNTVMHHIFLGINPRSVALSPYSPVLKNPYEVPAKRLELSINPGGFVFTLPTLAGHIGADVIADVLASRLHQNDETALLIDMGTNTQVVMGNRERLAAVSAPSGPAFEGGEIKDGMKAEIGAIEQVWIDPDTLDPGYKVIGDGKPRGICGSGIVDAIAHMYKSNIFSETGRWDAKASNERIRKTGGVAEYVLAWSDVTATAREIVVTHHDVRAIQLAKAAVASGIAVLCRHLGAEPSDIRRTYLAGAFGTYVDPQSARTIGMYPELPLSRVQFIGNAAGVGAKLALVSKAEREEAIKLSKFMEFVPLSGYPDFRSLFLKNTGFPPIN